VREIRTHGSMGGRWKRSMVKLVRHRQPKGSETDRPNLNHRATSRLYCLLTSSGLLNPPCKSAISSVCESHPANRSLGRRHRERRKSSSALASRPTRRELSDQLQPTRETARLPSAQRRCVAGRPRTAEDPRLTRVPVQKIGLRVGAQTSNHLHCEGAAMATMSQLLQLHFRK